MKENGNTISDHIYKSYNKELFQNSLLDFYETFLIDREKLVVFHALNDDQYSSSVFSRERYTFP